MLHGCANCSSIPRNFTRFAANYTLSHCVADTDVSDGWLVVTTTRDIAKTGITPQRVNQVNANPYGDRSLDNYLSAASFAAPAPGTYGNHRHNSIEGPGF